MAKAPVPKLRMAATVAAAALEELLVAEPEPEAAVAVAVAVALVLAELVVAATAVKLSGLS